MHDSDTLCVDCVWTMVVQAECMEQQKRCAQAESSAVSHRAEAASLFRQAEVVRQEVVSLKQELASSRQRSSEVEAELRSHAIGVKADADATTQALRSQLAASADKLRR